MVNMKARPFYLSDEDIKWVNDTIAGMTDEEKVGQLFFQLTGGVTEEYLTNLISKYHLGGIRYNPAPGKVIQNHNRIIQSISKVPTFIACNTEQGGSGACPDGTTIAPGIKIGATGKNEYAFALGKMSNEEAAAIGCNMAFAPVCDIVYNWENTECISRAFGNDPQRVADMSVEYLKGAHTIPGFACAAKHFPGNGQDFRDAHLSNNLNMFGVEEWDETYGLVYRSLIENDLDAIMAGHIIMPNYSKALDPSLAEEDIMPATLSKEIMNGLLREKLGFNGMVVTDASHMVGMTDRMKRSDMLPFCINAGCDMFLFFNDPDEDFATMLNAYKTGIISEERMTEALTRILALKAKMGLNKKAKEELVPSPEFLADVLGRQEYKDMAKAISGDAITLVKNKQPDMFPITPERYKRIMLVDIKGAEGAMAALMKLFMPGGARKPVEILCDKLKEKGFDAFVYESPLDKIKKQMEAGEKVDANIYFAGKNAIADFTSGMDLVISFCNVNGGRPSFGLSKGGGEIPWYVYEVPVLGVSVNMPTMLADMPMLRNYVNCYDSAPHTLDALVEAMMTGDFKGKDPIDSFCGVWDARL